MTVCVGAVCESGRAVVLAADRMLTGLLQIEAPSAKIVPVRPRCAAAFAGNESDARSVVIRGGAQVPENGDAIATREAFRSAYADFKAERVEESILRPALGADLATFRQMLTVTPFSQVLSNVATAVAGHNLGVDLLVAVADHYGTELFGVGHPGSIFETGGLHFMSIGNGALFSNAALAAWSRHHPNATLAQTIYNVAYAKRTAEIAAGVGVYTDVVVVTTLGVFWVNPQLVIALREPWTEGLTLLIEQQALPWLPAQPPPAAPPPVAPPQAAAPPVNPAQAAPPPGDHAPEEPPPTAPPTNDPE